MRLQIKEETYIEVSKAFGASSLRIIFKHIVPLLVPVCVRVNGLVRAGRDCL